VKIFGSALLQPAPSVCVSSERFFSYCHEFFQPVFTMTKSPQNALHFVSDVIHSQIWS